MLLRPRSQHGDHEARGQGRGGCQPRPRLVGRGYREEHRDDEQGQDDAELIPDSGSLSLTSLAWPLRLPSSAAHRPSLSFMEPARKNPPPQAIVGLSARGTMRLAWRTERTGEQHSGAIPSVTLN